MTTYHRAAAVVLGAILSAGAAFSTGGGVAMAAPVKVYDTATRTYYTYDPEKLRRDAFGPRGPARREQPRELDPFEGTEPVTATRPGRRAEPVAAVAAARHAEPDPKFDRQVVLYDSDEAPGTIIIDTQQKFLYYLLPDGEALRMGVGVGREGFGWTGTVHVGNKQVAPKWFPPDDMIGRQPELAKYKAEGMPGGEGNPLGMRAVYLHDENGKDTLYRIHGTIEPWSIGLNVSSGCIRLLNENVIDLYDRVEIGAKVIVM